MKKLRFLILKEYLDLNEKTSSLVHVQFSSGPILPASPSSPEVSFSVSFSPTHGAPAPSRPVSVGTSASVRDFCAKVKSVFSDVFGPGDIVLLLTLGRRVIDPDFDLVPAKGFLPKVLLCRLVSVVLDACCC